MIGVGDGYNDFPLLEACGLKVAMGNALEDLKGIADYIAPSVDEDGVANVIEKFILI
jgi:hydroxymethylpyrimidine pyrophosphatase-like HAD family hydrolase